MYNTVDMRALQDRLDAISETVVDTETEIQAAAEETAAETPQVEGVDEFAEFQNLLGRSGVLGFK